MHARGKTSKEIWPPIEYLRPKAANLAWSASTNFLRMPCFCAGRQECS